MVEVDVDAIFQKIQSTEKKLSALKDERYKLSIHISSLESYLEELRNEHNILKIKNRPDTSYWSTNEFTWTADIKKKLKETFHFDSFRPKQLAAINATLSKKDCILVIPTGGGKSLIYQLPASFSNKLTLVISPLISLISDQLIGLQKLGIQAATLNASSTKVERKCVHDSMVDPKSKLRLLYVTPEWVAKSKVFFNYLTKCHSKQLLERIVIDEVHCCSTWGHDFRPDYGQLNFFKTSFEEVPILGLTATATMQVLNDVQKMLDIPDAVIITAPFNRPNLYYKVIDKPEKAECLDYLEKLITRTYKNQTGIIYALTIKDCDEIALALKQRGIKIGPYHANLEPSNKQRVHERWLTNRYQVVIATIAFGMGIDKPDVRFVIHHSVPRSMEGLYQESGRAGRNGDRADCIVMFSFNDVLKNIGMSTSVTSDRNALSVLHYCLNNTKCRRELISKHFEDTWTHSMCNKMCDICENPPKVFQYDVKFIYDMLSSIITKCDEKFTLIKLVNSLFQKMSKQNKLKISKVEANLIIAILLDNHYFKVTKGATLYGYIAYIEVKGQNSDKEIIISVNKKLKGFTAVGEDVSDDDEPPAKKKK